MKKKITLGLLFGSLALSIPFINAKTNKVESNGDTVLLFGDDYYVNDYLEIPTNSIIQNKKEYQTDSYVTYPDGSMYRKNNVTFLDAGEYTITYIAKEDQSIKETYTIKAFDRKYHFSSNTVVRSTATYGVDSSKYNTGIEGLTVKLYEGETFYYDDLIDLNACQDEGTCDFLKFFALPETVGKMDLERFHIRLTDSVDDSIYLDIYVFPYPVRSEPENVPITTDENWKYFDTFIRVGGQNQQATGLDWKADGTCSVNKTNLSGFAAAHSMYGYSNYYKGYNQPRECTVGKEILNMGLNLETLEFNSTHRIGGRSSVVCDLDDVKYIEEPWTGFTNGKVKMSIDGFMYRDAFNIPFTFMITKLANNDLRIGNIIDNEGPEVQVKEQESNCYVNTNFKIPTPTIVDSKSKCKKLNTAVYYNYNSSTEYELEIEDGYFKPDKKGIYTIEYGIKDYFNNETIYKYRVNAIEGSPSDFNISLPNNTFNLNAGETTTLVEPIISNDEVEIKRSFTFNGNEIELVDNTYKFESAGTYKLTYIATDIYGNSKNVEATYNVNGNQKPIFEEEAILPMYYVQNGTYKTPTFNAYDYNNGKKILESIFSIDVGNGLEIINSDTYTINVTNPEVEEIEVKFIVSNEYGTVNKAYTIPYVNPKIEGKGYDLTKLIVGNNIKSVATEDYIEISSLKTNKETNFGLANPLDAEDLSISFKVNKSKASFDSIDLTIVDYDNPNIKLVFNIKKNGDNSSIFTVNGNEYNMQAGFKNDTTISLSYSNITRIIRSSDFNIFLNKDANQNEFAGFPSKKCYVLFNLNNVYATAGIILTKVNTQTFTDNDMDYIKPTIITFGEYKTSYNYGEEITIFKSEGIDVIDPSPNTTLTIRHFDGYQTYDVNGLLLVDVPANKEYKVKLENYGKYIVEYSSIDASKRQKQFMYSFDVIDNISPTFNVENTIFNLNVGEEIDFRNIKVVDNVDQDISFYTNMVLPNGKIEKLDKKIEGLKFMNPGVYYIRFIATDKADNQSIVTYKVIVK